MPESHCRRVQLPELAVLVVEGADAEAFLAAQLSRRPPAATEARAPLAAWHDAKGRVQGLFRVLRLPAAFWLLTPADVAGDLATELRRFVLRSRVALRVADELGCIALVGDCTDALADSGVALTRTAGASATQAGVSWLRLGDDLVQAVGALDALAAVGASLPAGEAADAALAEIRLGLPTVGIALRGIFLPQMLNLDELGAVEFDKGCYPGQEIIARTQNLGSVKRRLTRLETDQPSDEPAPGAPITDAAGVRVGGVVRAARHPRGLDVLAVVELDALTRELRCGSAGEIHLRPAAPDRATE